MNIRDTIIWCMKHGELTLSDVSRWLQTSRLTVRSWTIDGREPRERKLERIEYRLGKLAELIKQNGAIVPQTINDRQRPDYIRDKANEVCGTVLKKDPPTKRDVLFGRILQE